MFKISTFGEAHIGGVISIASPVEMYLGSTFCGSASPVKKGEQSYFEFPNPVGKIVKLEDIVFRAQGVLEAPDIDDSVIGYLPRKIDVERALRTYYRTVANYPEVPQDILNYIGSGAAGQAGYRAIGFTYFHHLLKYLGIETRSRILDIGCGAGRIGFAIAPYLKNGNGVYIGYDTWQAGIEWARSALQPHYPLLSFKTMPSPVQGRRKGYLASYAGHIAESEATFDHVISTSLFTHLKRVAYSDYFAQVYQLLKPNGTALVTAFLIDSHEGAWLRQNKTNDEDEDGLYVLDDTYADSYLWADKFFEEIERQGLIVCRYMPGSWRKVVPDNTTQHCENHQDILILKRPGSGGGSLSA